MKWNTAFGKVLKHGVYVGLLAYIAFALTHQSHLPSIDTHDETSSIVSEDMPWVLPPSHEHKKLITIGSLQSVESATRSLSEAGIKLNEWGKRALRGVNYSSRQRVLFFTAVSVEELGFSQGAARTAIYAAAEARGLSVCPAEVGVQLWLSYPELFKSGEWALVASEPIEDARGYQYVFNLYNNGESRVLEGSTGKSNDWWDGYRRWVFCVERPETQA